MNRSTRRGGRAFGRLLGAGLAVFALSACSLEVFNPGAITDASLNDPTLMDVVAAGVANEFNQLPDGFALDGLRLTDQAAGNGSYNGTGRLRRGMLEWDETAGLWGQVHETIWTGLSAWYRMSSLDDYDQDTSMDAARVWLMIGFAHRTFGEQFCDVVYSVGADFASPEEGGVLPRTAAFDSAMVAFNRAITIATAAGEPDDDIVVAARAGIAQSYAAAGDFDNATVWSVQVPTDFVYEALYNQNSNSNTVWIQTIGRNEVGLFNSYAYNLASEDPRVEYNECGTFDDPTDPFNSTVIPTGTCNSENGADGVTAHVQQLKYPDEGSDIPVAKGTEMRLIEAEAALLDDDMATFADRINDVREHWDLDPIDDPAEAGALEYENSPTAPFARVLHNAYDASVGDVTAPGVDAWSILDGERHLTMWGEGRRLYDLHRWDHPFLDGGLVFWDAEERRVSCYPVPEDECTLNDAISGATLQTGIGTGTQTCR